jgi:hypothetical protein
MLMTDADRRPAGERGRRREVSGVSGVLEPPCVFFTMIVGRNSGTG